MALNYDLIRNLMDTMGAEITGQKAIIAKLQKHIAELQAKGTTDILKEVFHNKSEGKKTLPPSEEVKEPKEPKEKKSKKVRAEKIEKTEEPKSVPEEPQVKQAKCADRKAYQQQYQKEYRAKQKAEKQAEKAKVEQQGSTA